jgi:diguanylate cyclase (GGDEF)-like protein
MMRNRQLESERKRDSRAAAAAQAAAPAVPTPVAAEPYIPTRLYYIPAYWKFIAAAMAGSMLPGLADAHALPGPAVVLPALAAIILGAATRLFIRLEREVARNVRQRSLVMLLAVGLPMLLYGVAAAAWAREQGNSLWIGAVGMIVLTSGAAAIFLARRSPAMLTAMTAAWLPLIVAAADREAWLIFVLGGAGGTLLVVRQTRIYGAALAKRRHRERVQERALDILIDYERSGQGWFWETDCDGAITYLSAGLEKVFGRPVEELHGRPFVELFVPDASGYGAGATSLTFHFSARTVFQDLLVRAVADSQERWWAIGGSPIHDRHGTYFGFRGFGTDQTEKRRSLERTSRLAHYDSLTGLANRFQMSQSLETILKAPHQDRGCAIFLIDLDRFKQVNDTLGHPGGDAVLKQVAERLRRTIGSAGRMGRLGGDEFQVILPGQSRREDLAALADRVVAELSEPYIFDGQRAMIGASIGIALAPEDGVTSEALIRNADLALYAAKDAGRGRHHFYAPDLHSDAEERRELEEALREAIGNGGLELWYQPVIQTSTETIAGFEALLRWTHPRLGEISPEKFVPIAEDAGLIAPIGEWALRTACRDLATWPEPISVAVNISPLQFANPALPAIVTSALASAEVAPSRLELEITESVFLGEDSATEATFAALKRIGVRLALDDFGTGYSSLGYLEAAPLDRIKIDPSLMRGAAMPGSRNAAILASIVNLADALGMATTAEGVETQHELDLVRNLGCSHVQGYVYEAPMSLADTLVCLEFAVPSMRDTHRRPSIAIASAPRAAEQPEKMQRFG